VHHTTPPIHDTCKKCGVNWGKIVTCGPPYGQSVLWTITTPIVFALITVIGVIGNTFVVMVIVTRRVRRQNPTNILLLNLAVADLAFLVVCVPFTAVKYAAASWPLGDTTCRIVNYLLYT